MINWPHYDPTLRKLAGEGLSMSAISDRVDLPRSMVRQRLLYLGVYKTKASGATNGWLPWSAEADAWLLDMDARGVPAAERANNLGKSIPACRIRLCILKKEKNQPAPSKRKEPEPVERSPNFGTLSIARTELGDRLTERNGVTFIDGKMAMIQDIIKAAQASMQRRGESLPGVKPDKWGA